MNINKKEIFSREASQQKVLKGGFEAGECLHSILFSRSDEVSPSSKRCGLIAHCTSAGKYE